MRIYRYADQGSLQPKLAAVTDDNEGYTLPQISLEQVVIDAEKKGLSLLQYVESLISDCPRLERAIDEYTLLTPVEAPEVWAAGVTYERSREARNYEATAGRMDASTFYDKVYEADRPELFFKSTAARTVHPGGDVTLRSDSEWQVPEPELGLVINRDGQILGYTIGNDMSCRDIEGENPLYLPQAKMWRNSCSFGPAIRLAETVEDPYNLDIECRIYRGGQEVFRGNANTRQLKRRYDELVSYLIRDNQIMDGTVLLTGTCIVPPNDFSLSEGDRIEIEIGGIGKLVNYVNSKRADRGGFVR